MGGRNVVATVFQCGTDTVAAFADGGIGQADCMKMILIGLYPGDIYFDFDDVGINAIHCCAEGFVEHWDGCLAGSCGINPARRDDASAKSLRALDPTSM